VCTRTLPPTLSGDAFIGALAARLVDGASQPEATRFANAAAALLSAQRPSRNNQSPSIGLLNSSRNPIGGDGNRHAIPYLLISIAPIEHLWCPLHIHAMMRARERTRRRVV